MNLALTSAHRWAELRMVPPSEYGVSEGALLLLLC
jgi:hypothetical protein